MYLMCKMKSCGSAVGMATGYRLNDRDRSSSPDRDDSIHFSISSRVALRPTKPIQGVSGALSSGLK
jgi:hypothetical protein